MVPGGEETWCHVLPSSPVARTALPSVGPWYPGLTPPTTIRPRRSVCIRTEIHWLFPAVWNRRCHVRPPSVVPYRKLRHPPAAVARSQKVSQPSWPLRNCMLPPSAGTPWVSRPTVRQPRPPLPRVRTRPSDRSIQASRAPPDASRAPTGSCAPAYVTWYSSVHVLPPSVLPKTAAVHGESAQVPEAVASARPTTQTSLALSAYTRATSLPP